MLHGPTGTGKTELARYIAKELSWPLYRLDLGSLYSRWQGESERNLRSILSFMSTQGEAVFLLDEAEKLFGNEAMGQASLSTLLSMLLWWLQGATNRTVTVMTANKLDVIPPELYRPGRLDAVHKMEGLTQIHEAKGFAALVAEATAKRFGLDPAVLGSKVKIVGLPISQAALVAQVRSAAKQLIVGE
jgi:ATP-dependent 26S proteasome regulatory subunit